MGLLSCYWKIEAEVLGRIDSSLWWTGPLLRLKRFREARKTRQAMMEAFTELAVYANTHRQSKRGPPTAGEDDDL